MKINMYDELSETIINSEAELDLKTGEISNVKYEQLNSVFNKDDSFPYEEPTYEKTTAELVINNKKIEFTVDTNNSSYLVKKGELEKIKQFISTSVLNRETVTHKNNHTI